MDKSKKLAITAIGDAQGEGFIASSLERQGWQVIHRALSIIDLHDFLKSFISEPATLFQSSDFSAADVNLKHANIALVNLHSIPTSDHELSEIIRGQDNDTSHNWAKLPNIPILSFASFGRSVGTSTIALNVAAELADEGIQVLLVDAHVRSPFLSSHLEVFGVNREIVPTNFGFSIFEANDAASFAEIENEVAQYQILLIDIGELWQLEKSITGNRAEDFPFAWASHFSTELISISSGQNSNLSEIKRRLNEIEPLAIKPRCSHIINFSQSYSPKALGLARDRAVKELARPTIFLPRDDRAALRAKSAASTLLASAPKSALRGEITRYCRDSNWRLG